MNAHETYLHWLNAPALTEAERAELRAIEGDEDEILSRFSSYLSFGTAGLRGTMKVGTNAMNVHTVAHATQGLANLILKEGRAADGVAIAYDSRNNSPLFARTAAAVLAANGIGVYPFDELRPTPELSFALRHLHCVAGINITASHNPKAYNGYKAYWEDGAQLPPEHAAVVSEEIGKLDIFHDIKTMDVEDAIARGLIRIIGAEVDEAYLKEVQAQAINPDAIRAVADDLHIIYTPLHGAGYRLVPEILSRCGLKHLHPVAEQMQPNGDFPTVQKPNPEYPEVFELGVALANEKGADLIIATDPDTDRVGVSTRKPDGSFTTITGNQMGALLIDYIITAYEQTGTMPEGPYAVKTIVTSEMAAKICAAHGVKMYNVLTGFKFIGEVIKNHEQAGYGTFLFGFEESYGYLKGTYARDKDAVVATMLIAEMTAYYKAQNKTLFDALEELYARYGFCMEKTAELEMPGVDGPARMAALMEKLRKNPPANFHGYAVVTAGDYAAGTLTDLRTGKSEPTNLPASNVLSFILENGDVIVVRPSGTEPKVKFYYLLSGEERTAVEANLAAYRAEIDALTK